MRSEKACGGFCIGRAPATGEQTQAETAVLDRLRAVLPGPAPGPPCRGLTLTQGGSTSVQGPQWTCLGSPHQPQRPCPLHRVRN